MANVEQIGQFLKSLSALCLSLDSRWVQRSRKLNTLRMLHLLILQGWGDRKMGATTAIAQFMASCGSVEKISASAFSQARSRFHWQYMRQLFFHVRDQQRADASEFLWKNRRIFAVDGSRLTIPHAFKNKKYLCPAKNAHYPQALLTVLYQLKLGVPHQAKFCRHLNEQQAARHHLAYLQSGDVLVLDRGFFLLP